MKMGYFLPLILYSIDVVGLLVWHGSAEAIEDKRALLEFEKNFPPSQPLNWNERPSPCTSWTGVTCNEESKTSPES